MLHPAGEHVPVAGAETLDTFAGPVKVERDRSSPLTPFGQAVSFIGFLKVPGVFSALNADCPLRYTSPDAPDVRGVTGTWVLPVLAGRRRYARVTALRPDSVLPELMGMSRIVSEDSLRRALAAIPQEAGLAWLKRHLDRCVLPLLGERSIIDIDTAVKPLYGHQEGAVVSYNPEKPGRPSPVHHPYMLAGLRLVLGVETAAGNGHNGAHCTPGLWRLIDGLPRDCWPALLRGDSGIASGNTIREAESRGIDYLFKLRPARHVKALPGARFRKTAGTMPGKAGRAERKRCG